MTKRTRRTHAGAFKSKVALAALRGDETLAMWSPSGVQGAWACKTMAAAPGGPFVQVHNRQTCCNTVACPQQIHPPRTRVQGWASTLTTRIILVLLIK